METKNNNLWASICLILILLSVLWRTGTVFAEQLPAFPGAEGFGAYAIGGRFGDVYHVTNLNDSGPGSLRYGIETAESARTIVFDLSGNIELNSTLEINKPYLTIAGQTAPGDGICIKNYCTLITDTTDVIIRYLRCRPGDTSQSAIDALSIFNSKNIILDHCSASWSIDEVTSITGGSDNITIQWCIISEGLSDSYHPEGAHSNGTLIDPHGSCAITFHHNIWAHNYQRNPDAAGSESGKTLQLDWRNNVTYNWRYRNGRAGRAMVMNYIGNYCKAGPSTLANHYNIAWECSSLDIEIYQEDDIINGTIIGWDMVIDDYTKRFSPFSFAPVSTDDPQTAYREVLDHAGATMPARDVVDARIINDIENGTGEIISSQTEVGGWPVLSSAPAPADTDQDGMPDYWETEHGFDPCDPADRNDDYDRDGYTNLEEYLNDIANAPAVCGDMNYPYPAGDLNLDCYADFVDLTVLAEHWLECIDRTNSNCDIYWQYRYGESFTTDPGWTYSGTRSPESIGVIEGAVVKGVYYRDTSGVGTIPNSYFYTDNLDEVMGVTVNDTWDWVLCFDFWHESGYKTYAHWGLTSTELPDSGEPNSFIKLRAYMTNSGLNRKVNFAYNFGSGVIYSPGLAIGYDVGTWYLVKISWNTIEQKLTGRFIRKSDGAVAGTWTSDVITEPFSFQRFNTWDESGKPSTYGYSCQGWMDNLAIAPIE